MAVKFIAKLARYGVYVFAVISYAHFIPALSGFGTAGWASDRTAQTAPGDKRVSGAG